MVTFQRPVGHDASSHTSLTRAASARFSVPLVQRFPVAPQIPTVASSTERLSPCTELFSSWFILRVRPILVMPHQGGLYAEVLNPMALANPSRDLVGAMPC